jgi:hypothetical protein
MTLLNAVLSRRDPPHVPPINSLQLTRLACGEMGRALPAGMRENGSAVARAAGRLSSRPLVRQANLVLLIRCESLWGKI